MGRQHKNTNPFFTTHGIFRTGARIARCCTENIKCYTRLSQCIFKQIAEQLHGNILESQRRPIRQGQNMESGFERFKRRNVITTKNFSCIRAIDDYTQIDQFGQPDERWTTGFTASHTLFHKIGAFDAETTVGVQLRNDNIQNALTRTHAQKTMGITRQDTVWVTSISPYIENRIQWQRWLRTNLGVRFDGFRFDNSRSNIQENNGTRYDGLVSPKLSIVLGPWADTEFYLNGGLGFHSNDARGIDLPKLCV